MICNTRGTLHHLLPQCSRPGRHHQQSLCRRGGILSATLCEHQAQALL